MCKQLFTNQRRVKTGLVVAVALLGCLIFLALTFFRRPAHDAGRQVRSASAPEFNSAAETLSRKLEGEGARVYLERTSEGQS